MKSTSAERLSKALISLQHRINEYCEMHKESTLKMGMCLVNPKEHFLDLPQKKSKKN